MQRPVIVSPGPVDVSADALFDLPSLHHRSREFERVMSESAALLGEALGTRNAVHFITASGSGAMEAAVVGATAPDSKLLVLSCGKFGDRWAEIGAAYGCDVSMFRVPEGAAFEVDAVIDRIRRERPDAVALTHVESSSGVLFPLRELAEELGAERPVLIVDAISSFAAEALEVDAWGVDVVTGASQKAIGAPAGMSFVSIGGRASLSSRRGAYYFDVRRYGRDGGVPFTPAIMTMQVIHRSLGAMKRVGFEAVRERHRRASRAFLSACGRLGLVSVPEAPSSSVQVLRLPNRLSGKDFLDALSARGFVAAGGQGALEGRVMRTGFLGLYDRDTLLRLVRGVGSCLEEAGFRVDTGAAEDLMRDYSEEEPLFAGLGNGGSGRPFES